MVYVLIFINYNNLFTFSVSYSYFAMKKLPSFGNNQFKIKNTKIIVADSNL